MNKKLIFILKGYPRLSETFILQEMVALEAQGFELHIMAMRHPHDNKTHELVDKVKARVTYLPIYVKSEWRRVFAAWRKRKIPLSFWKVFLKRLWLKKSFKPIQRAAQALVMLAEMPEGFTHIHAHFIHAPAELAFYAHLLSGLPYTISAHAKDIWTSSREDLIRKMECASWVTCCTGEGQTYLQSLTTTPVHLIYHGIDLNRFPIIVPSLSDVGGGDEAKKLKICLVGRLVPKKGIDVLFDALAALPPHLCWELSIAGGGELKESLSAKARDLNLADDIHFLGSVTAEEVKSLLQSSDLFVLPCRVQPDGDRDGIPNVIMEAISQGLPVLSTKVGGIEELLCDKSAILVNPNDASALSEALSVLITNPQLRYALAKEAQQKLQQSFRLEQGISRLAKEFEDTLSLRTTDTRS